MILADTSGLLCLFNVREPQHAAVRDIVAQDVEPLVLSPYVIAELDYLVSSRLGHDAELAVLKERMSRSDVVALIVVIVGVALVVA